MNRSLAPVASLILTCATNLAGNSLEAAQESIEDYPVITVHVYNYAQIPALRLARTQKRVEGFFLGAGIQLKWADTPLPSAGRPRPAGPAWNPDGSDFVLKIVSGFPKSAGQMREPVFGFAAGTQVTVFNKRTEDIAFNAEVTHPEILAIVIAHELGHALLGPKSHSDTGIMRPRMQPEDFRKAQCMSLSFTPEQAERMHRQVVQSMTQR
jgi:hypothetical protein